MIRAFQWDIARQVERLDWLLAQLPRYADWGYQELYLHLEDAVDYPSFPSIARIDAYRHRDLLKLVKAAESVGIKTVPIVNLLGHTQYLVKTPELRELNELRSESGSPLESGQICPVHPRTLDVARKLINDVTPFCTAGKVHVGLDESFKLGQHPLSRKEVARIGLAAHFAKYVQRLNRVTRASGFEMGMWADMLYFLPEAIPLLPSQITAYEWYYHAFRRHPRVELFNFAEADLTTPLLRRGLKYYGCPMNGAFRYEPLPHFSDRIGNILAWWKHNQRVGAEGFLVSSWEPFRLAIELTTVVDAAAASLWLDGANSDPEQMLARGFERVFGRASARHAAKVALACDRYPFSGYPRWEINSRWDTVSRRESLVPYRREARHFARLARVAREKSLPAPLRDSVEFRRYLADRDVAARQLSRNSDLRSAGAKKNVAELSVAIRAGRRAGRSMWNRSRDASLLSPNEQIIDGDAQRLRAWRRGEPVFGGKWQLCYRVWNFAPAVQRVGVEQLDDNGTWQVLQSCHTIEFQTAAAQPRTRIVREHAAPVRWDGSPSSMPRLRLFVEGVGAVRVGDIELRGKNRKLTLAGTPSRWRVLGQPAPRQGLPVLDRHETLELRFSR